MSMSHPLETPRAWKVGSYCLVHSTGRMGKLTRPRRALSCWVGKRQAFAPTLFKSTIRLRAAFPAAGWWNAIRPWIWPN